MNWLYGSGCIGFLFQAVEKYSSGGNFLMICLYGRGRVKRGLGFIFLVLILYYLECNFMFWVNFINYVNNVIREYIFKIIRRLYKILGDYVRYYNIYRLYKIYIYQFFVL